MFSSHRKVATFNPSPTARGFVITDTLTLSPTGWLVCSAGNTAEWAVCEVSFGVEKPMPSLPAFRGHGDGTVILSL